MADNTVSVEMTLSKNLQAYLANLRAEFAAEKARIQEQVAKAEADNAALRTENERLHASMDRIRSLVGRWLAEPDGPPTEEMIYVMDELDAFGRDA